MAMLKTRVITDQNGFVAITVQESPGKPPVAHVSSSIKGISPHAVPFAASGDEYVSLALDDLSKNLVNQLRALKSPPRVQSPAQPLYQITPVALTKISPALVIETKRLPHGYITVCRSLIKGIPCSKAETKDIQSARDLHELVTSEALDAYGIGFGLPGEPDWSKLPHESGHLFKDDYGQ